MVTKLYDRVCIDAFTRELDLAKIFEDAPIESAISCHEFWSWYVEKGALIRFPNILIGRKCVVKGKVTLGVNVGGKGYIQYYVNT
jgi:hypothetical protein